MKIVILDGHTLNPGDLSWDGLAALGDLQVYDRTPPEQTGERLQGAEIVLTNKVVLSGELISQLPDLKYIGVLATGYNVVDLDAAVSRQIPVTNVPSYGTPAVAQMVFAHLLNLCHRVGHHAKTVRDGRWTDSADFCYWDVPLVELAGLKMGIIGLGRIGRATAALAQAFGMDVLGHDDYADRSLAPGVSFVPLAMVLTQSDVISLHCPLTMETENLINGERLAQMKPTAFLINTGRGPLIDETALAEALNDGRLAGAGLDVLSVEPPAADNPLLTAKNCFITPHIAWATRAARSRLLSTVVENISAFLAGRLQNVVNGVGK